MRSKWIKRAISIVALIIFTYLFIPLLKEIKNAAYLFTQAEWIWLPIILLFVVVSYSWLTWLNALGLKPFPGNIPFFRLMATLTSIAFIQIAIPSAGVSSMVLRIHLLSKRGYSVEASTFSFALETIFLAVAMSTIAAVGFLYLLEQGKVTQIMIAIIVMLTVLAIVLVWYLWRLLQDYRRSRIVLGRFVRIWNRLPVRRYRLEEEALNQRLIQFQTNLSTLVNVPLWMFILGAYGRVFMDVYALSACFRMFSYPINFGTLIIGYGLILLLSGLAALPGGLGLAELSIPVIFNQLGVPGAVALAAGLSYRLFAFWLIRLVGFFTWQFLEADRPSIKELRDIK